MITELQPIPDELYLSEIYMPLDHELSTVEHGIGSIVIGREATLDEESINNGVDLLNAEANGLNVRPEDVGRSMEVQAAHEAALDENRIFDAYTQAHEENEIFDAHVAALQENEIFDAHIEAIKENDERNEQDAKKLTELETVAANKQIEAAALDLKQSKDGMVGASTYKQAEQALKDAGYTDEVPSGSQVYKDYETGNIVIANSFANNIRLVQFGSGGGNKVTDYRFDKEEGVLTIKIAGGNTTIAQVNKYAPTDDMEQAVPKAITLPPIVARSVGFARVTPINA